jgi:YebC/PmpR family DNA-binding regulatory protein
MSGHSKWSTIKRQKGAADQKRGMLFTKLSNAISVAAKAGGSADPAMNFRLRLAIDAAKAANMPKDNIERAIARAAGKGEQTLVEQVYEGFGPGGFSIIVEAVTDNTNRTSSEIRGIFEKNGGSFANPGAVSYQFEPKGEIIVSKNSDLDDVFMTAADNGAEDVREEEEGLVVYTTQDGLSSVQKALNEKGFAIENASLTRIPTTMLEVPDEDTKQKAINLIEKLEEHPDVTEVYENLN